MSSAPCSTCKLPVNKPFLRKLFVMKSYFMNDYADIFRTADQSQTICHGYCFEYSLLHLVQLIIQITLQCFGSLILGLRSMQKCQDGNSNTSSLNTHATTYSQKYLQDLLFPRAFLLTKLWLQDYWTQMKRVLDTVHTNSVYSKDGLWTVFWGQCG